MPIVSLIDARHFLLEPRKTVKTPSLFGARSVPRSAEIGFLARLVRILPSLRGMVRTTLSRVRRNSGFTLSEIVVALSIAGVVASLAMPASGKLLDRYRLSSAVSQIKMEIGRARMQAIGQNRYVRVMKTSAGLVREVSPNGTSYTQDGGAVSLPKGVTLQFGDAGGPKFNRQGMSTTISYMVINNTQGFKILWVNRLGRVQVL
jgi:prepilin-type N-terminal cleavage/methylation domain-containing protein